MVSVEAGCFPQAEAAGKEAFAERLRVFGDHFWLLEDEGTLVGFINGLVTNEETIDDLMYEKADLHIENGAWQTVFGVDTIPQYRRKGCAALLLQRLITDAKKQGRKGCILTCKKELVHYYEKFGFQNWGQSQSVHGGVRHAAGILTKGKGLTDDNCQYKGDFEWGCGNCMEYGYISDRMGLEKRCEQDRGFRKGLQIRGIYGGGLCDHLYHYGF